MSDNRLVFAGIYGGAWLLSALISAYMTFLRAPAVIEVRPGLAEVGFWTALFSGRFSPWLFHTHPLAGTVVVFFVWTAIVTVFIKTA